MSKIEQISSSVYRPGTLITRVRENFMHTSYDKEKRIIQSLPPVYIRLFGDIDYEKQLSEIPDKFREKVVVLTTCDTADEVVSSLRTQKWNVVQSTEVTAQEARTNASTLLNEGLKVAREQHHNYAFFLSSGFQRHLDMFYSMFHEATKRHPNQDAYYFVLPETHKNLSLQSHEQMNRTDIDDFLQKGFPYETALFMRTSMPSFETNLSVKGNLGTMAEGIPLGGMEFLLTLLDTYKIAKGRGKTFSPKMIGITLPILTRSSQSLVEFYRRTHELPESFFDSLKLAPSLEVTPTSTKTARRTTTWRTAMAKLNIIDDDVRKLFSHTQFELGITDAFQFTDEKSSIL